MSASNPYDRRRDDRERRSCEAMAAGFGGIRSTVEFEDLEAMVAQAAARGRREASLQAHERERMARREAWQEGHDVGESDGRSDLLTRIDHRCGAEVRSAIKATKEMLTALEEDGRRVPKSDLQERLERLARLLEWLVGEHHNEFVEIPF